jgi:DNA-binding PadR family transcriptional regulator
MSVRFAILGLLHYRSMHGYEIKRHIENHFGHMWTINYGQIYPNLKSLEEEACITLADVTPAERGGPQKKLYAITPDGRKKFLQWLESEEYTHMSLRDPFLMRFIFFGFGNKKQSLSIIDKQIEIYDKQLDKRRQHLERWRERGEYVRLVAELGEEFNFMYLQWLKRARQEIINIKEQEGIKENSLGQLSRKK